MRLKDINDELIGYDQMLATFLVKIFFKKIPKKACILYIKCDTIIV